MSYASRDGASTIANLLLTMFPSRAILSTVVLAVFASTAPLTVQVEVVLDDVKTPDHNDMTSHCDGLTTVSFPGLGYKPTVCLPIHDLC